MSKIRIIVCDDDVIQQKIIRNMLSQYLLSKHVQTEVSIFSSGKDCLIALEKERGEATEDIFLLDIYMPDINGIGLARMLREKGLRCQIIFITGGNEYASEAFEVDAFSYLQKPVRYERFEEVMDRILLRISRTLSLDIVVEREQKRIYFSDIRYAETLNRKLYLYTDSGEYVTYLPLSRLLSELNGDFVQISRFTVVSLWKTVSIDMKNLYLADGTVLPVGEKYLAEVRERFEKYKSRR